MTKHISKQVLKEIVKDYLDYMTLKDLSKKYSLSETIIFNRLHQAGVKRATNIRPSSKRIPEFPPLIESEPKELNMSTAKGFFNVDAVLSRAGRNWLF